MGTYTSRLALFKPTKGDGGAIDDFVDVAADVNTNMDIVDTNIGMRLVTSGNLPANPFIGMYVLETDTGFVRVWTGSVWELEGTDKSSIGFIGITTATADGASLTSASAETLYMSVTFSAFADRRYAIEYQTYVMQSAGAFPGNMRLRVRAAFAGTVTNTDTLLGNEVSVNVVHANGATSAESAYSYHDWPAGFTGTATVGLFAITTIAAHTLNIRANVSDQMNWISVRDVGGV